MGNKADVSTTTKDLAVAQSAEPAVRGGYQLALMPGESVVIAGTPDRSALLKYTMSIAAIIAGLGVFTLPLLLIVYPIVKAWVKRHRYWVTDKRIIVSNGIIGYRARSVPFERISDVAISANWLERIFGLRSVMVRDMTGEAESGAALLASPDAEGLQEEILSRVAEANQGHRTEPSLGGPGRPYRGAEQPDSSDQMLALLRRIEENTRSRE